MYKYNIGDGVFCRGGETRYVSTRCILNRRYTDCNEYKFGYWDRADKCTKYVWFREKQIYESRLTILNTYKNG